MLNPARACVERTPQGGWSWDIATDRLQLDPAFLALVARRPTGMPARFDFMCQLVHGDDLAGFREAMIALQAGRPRAAGCTLRMVTDWGEVRHVLLEARVLQYGSAGEVLRVGGTVHEAVPSAGLHGH